MTATVDLVTGTQREQTRARYPDREGYVERDGVRVGTGSQPVLLRIIQPPGKKQMNAADWARGARLDESTRAE